MFYSKTGLLTSKWDQYYFFIQGGSLMYQGVDEVRYKSNNDILIFVCTVIFALFNINLDKNISFTILSAWILYICCRWQGSHLWILDLKLM